MWTKILKTYHFRFFCIRIQLMMLYHSILWSTSLVFLTYTPFVSSICSSICWLMFILLVNDVFSFRFKFVFTHVVILNVFIYVCFSVFCKFLCLTDETNLSRVVWIIIVGFTTTSQRCIVYHSMYNLNINSCRRLTDLSLQLARYLIHAWIVSVNCFKFSSDEVFQRVSRRSRFLSISSNSDWW